MWIFGGYDGSQRPSMLALQDNHFPLRDDSSTVVGVELLMLRL